MASDLAAVRGASVVVAGATAGEGFVSAGMAATRAAAPGLGAAEEDILGGGGGRTRGEGGRGCVLRVGERDERKERKEGREIFLRGWEGKVLRCFQGLRKPPQVPQE